MYKFWAGWINFEMLYFTHTKNGKYAYVQLLKVANVV